MFLRTIDRYLIRQALTPFLVTLLLLTFVLQMQPLIQRGETLIAQGASWAVVGQLLLTLVPQALAITIPMSLLVGLLMALGQLSADRETVAMQACGISLVRLLRPVGVLAGAAALATLYVNVVAVPAANQAFQRLSLEVISSWTQGEIRPHVFFRDFPGLVLYTGDEAEDQGWHDVFAADTGNPAAPRVYRADRGEIRIDAPSRTVQMILTDGESAFVDPVAPERFESTRFDRVVLALDPSRIFPASGPLKGPPESTIAELREDIARLDGELATCQADPDRDDEGCLRAYSTHNLVIAMHNKFAIPLACLVFALVALALGGSTRKEGKLSSFVIGIAVVYAYYFVMSIGESLAKGHQISPVFAAWMANLVLGSGAVALFVAKTRRVRGRALHVPLPRLPSLRALDRFLPWRDTLSSAEGPDETAAPRPRLVLRLPQVSWPGPTILDRYVMRSCGRVVGLSTGVLLGLFYIATFIDLSDKLFKGEATGGMILRLLWFSTPQYLYFIIPIAVLIGTLVTIGAITKNSELVVMKACGVSLYRVAIPLFTLALVGSACLFLLDERVLAYANRRADELNTVVRGRSPRSVDALNRRWLVGKDRSIYHYVFFDRTTDELNNLWIFGFDTDSRALSRVTFVNQASFQQLTEGEEDMAIWERTRGWDRALRPVAFTRLAPGPFALESPEYFGGEEPDAELMSFTDLRDYVEDLRAGGFNVTPYVVSLQRKLAFPFVTLVMVLIAVPFAVTTGRRGALYGIGAGIVLALVYWMAISTFAAIGSAGLVSPVLAAWAPNALFGMAAAYLLLTVRT